MSQDHQSTTLDADPVAARFAVGGLVLALLLCVGGVVIVSLWGLDVPPALAALASFAAGSLTSFLSPVRLRNGGHK